jgi:hypothetical protein
MTRKIRFWPVYGWVGLVAVAVCWLLNWMLPGVRTAYLFFSALAWVRFGGRCRGLDARG